ncbi:PREDICTED: zeatin O-glucosyltransferase [Theobroma cacao]|uniref:Glycosyltransferase n=1 Tax=Theobroma cacao TaxID=3641 RepID=A0AB32V4Z1_THECC|nr:PREDICTED: zeatin O-glucosyltransferase [Theobroma cacao]
MANHTSHQSYGSINHKQAPVAVIVVPFPGQSHLNQLLQLSCLLSSHKIPVHYVCSNIHNRQVKLRAHGLNSSQISMLTFHDLAIPPFISPPPNPRATTKFPTHLQPSFEAYLHLRHPVGALVSELSQSAERIIIIHDSVIASIIQDAASIPNAEIYAFQSISPFTLFYNIWEARGKPFQLEAEVAEIQNKLPSLDGCFSSEFVNFVTYQYQFMNFQAGELYNTCRLIDGTYINLLAKLQTNVNRKQWAIGPLNPLKIHEHSNPTRRHKCLEWLDKQTPKSVLYICFGSSTSMPDDQINELAIGLEQSKTKFIWVLRDADKGDISTEVRQLKLPEAFEARTERSGMVLRDWAPQLEILGHPSTGGFMSHCGWNSCMESISMGVPIAAWPMHSDQPRNTVLVTQVLQIGLVVKDRQRMEDKVTSSDIKEAVRRLMASKEGETMRKRAEELGEAVREQSAAQGGVSRVELESFIAHITS